MNNSILGMEPDWERVLSAAAHVPRVVPDAILLGRTVSEAEELTTDLKRRFAQVLADLNSVSGRQTKRASAPFQVSGNLDGIETGIRDRVRVQPLETTTVATPAGPITVPTIGEMLRIKAWLTISRNATRDYIDTAAIAELLGPQGSYMALRSLDDLYPQKNQQSPLQQVIRQLAEPKPYDFPEYEKAMQHRFTQHRFWRDRWNDWRQIKAACLNVGAVLIRELSIHAKFQR